MIIVDCLDLWIDLSFHDRFPYDLLQYGVNLNEEQSIGTGLTIITNLLIRDRSLLHSLMLQQGLWNSLWNSLWVFDKLARAQPNGAGIHRPPKPPSSHSEARDGDPMEASLMQQGAGFQKPQKFEHLPVSWISWISNSKIMTQAKKESLLLTFHPDVPDKPDQRHDITLIWYAAGPT